MTWSRHGLVAAAAVSLCLAGARAGTPKVTVVEPGAAQSGFGAEAGGLQAGLSADRRTFGYLGRMTVVPRRLQNRLKPRPIFEIFHLTLTLKCTGSQPVQVFQDANAAGATGAISAEVIGPDGKAVEPFCWAATPHAAANGTMVVLPPGQECKIDLTPAFFYDLSAVDPNYPPPPVMRPNALGRRHYGLRRAGTYRIRATYRDGAANIATNQVALTLHAEPPRLPRLAEFIRKAAKQPRMAVRSATLFGSPGVEQFVAAGSQADGTVVAFGNAFGKAFPDAGAPPAVLGKGAWRDVNEFVGGRESFWDEDHMAAGELDGEYPNQAGMIVRYAPGLAKVVSVARFDWGVATIDHGTVGPDGSLYVSGRCTEQFRSVANAAAVKVVPQPTDLRCGRKFYQGLWLSGDSYVARLSSDGAKVLWAWVFSSCRRGSRVWVDSAGGATFDIVGLKHVSPDGQKLTDVPLAEHLAGVTDLRLLAVSPLDRSVFRGGWRVANTGREVWKQPLLLAHDAAGRGGRALYGWHPGLSGHDDFRLVADSGFTAAEWMPDGTVWLCGWSGGADSVLLRSPVDLERVVKRDGFGMDLAGGQDARVPLLLHFDPRTRGVDLCAAFPAYGTWPDPRRRQRSDPEDALRGVAVSHFAVLADGALAIAGKAEPFVVQTPGAFGCSPEHDWSELPAAGAEGSFVAVFDPRCENLLFSSVLPGVEIAGLAATKGGLAVVGRTGGLTADGRSAPLVRPAQGLYAGGRLDAYILLLEKPQ